MKKPPKESEMVRLADRILRIGRKEKDVFFQIFTILKSKKLFLYRLFTQEP